MKIDVKHKSQLSEAVRVTASASAPATAAATVTAAAATGAKGTTAFVAMSRTTLSSTLLENENGINAARSSKRTISIKQTARKIATAKANIVLRTNIRKEKRSEKSMNAIKSILSQEGCDKMEQQQKQKLKQKQVRTFNKQAHSQTTKRRAGQRQQRPAPSPLLNSIGIGILTVLLGSVPIVINAFTETEHEINYPPTKYSTYGKNVSYVSDTAYNAAGMQPLYDITHKIMLSMVGKKPLPDGYITVKDDTVGFGPKVEHNEWGDLIIANWPILLLTIFVALLVISMPIIGLCFCCCRCAGNCGGRSEPFDKKHDTCRRVCLGFLLILLVIGILFGVIVAFVTNSFTQMGIEKTTNSARQGSGDTQTFLKNTADQVDHVLVTNYRELSHNLETLLKDISTFITDRLHQKSMALSFKYMAAFLEKLPDLTRILKNIRNITNDLRVHASQLSDGLRGVKRELLVMLNKCKMQACEDILNNYEIGKLDANGLHYDQLPDVSDIIQGLEALINEDIAMASRRGKEQLQELSDHLNESISTYTPRVFQAITKTGEAFLKASNEVRKELQQAANSVGRITDKGTDVADQYLKEYGPYRFYVGIAVCSILLLILVCLIIALLCGICGKRPGGYGDDCCNKGTGSRFLMIAVTLIFLTISAIALFAFFHFLVGIVGYRGFCMPLKDPQNDEIFAQIDQHIDLNRVLHSAQTRSNGGSGVLPPFRISHAIAACKQNQTIYEVLQIHNRFDINEIKDYPNQYKINQSLAELVHRVDLKDTPIVILSEEDKNRILEIKETALKDYDSARFTDNLKDAITRHSLEEIAKQLRDTANNVTSNDMKDVPISLRNQALHLETYERNLVIPMKQKSAELIKYVHQLDSMVRYKDHPFDESIPLLVSEIQKSQEFLNNEGQPFVKETAYNLSRYFYNEIDNYLDMVIKSFEKKVGLCEPLSRVYDASLVSFCNRVIDPMNGFWAGVFWCILLFLPTLLVAIKLAGLYQKSDPYPGPLVESDSPEARMLAMQPEGGVIETKAQDTDPITIYFRIKKKKSNGNDGADETDFNGNEDLASATSGNRSNTQANPAARNSDVSFRDQYRRTQY